MSRYSITGLRFVVLSAWGLAMVCDVGGQHIVPSVEWERLYDKATCDFYRVVQSDDGGYALGGIIYENKASEDDCVLVKINSQGEIQWEKLFGGIGSQNLRDLRPTTDGGYVFAGTSNSPPSFVEHSWVVKVDAEGKKQWEQLLNVASAASIWQTLDGGYVVAGGALGILGSGDGWLMKMDALGGIQWERLFGGKDSESFDAVRQTTDRGYISAGVLRSPASGNMEAPHFDIWDGWLVKADVEGNKQWERLFGGTEFDSFSSLDQTDDGGFILGGRSRSSDSTLQVYWLLKVDKEGNKEWERSYDLKQSSFLPNVRRTADQGYVFNGRSLIIKVDSKGNPQWEKVFAPDRSHPSPYRVEIKDLRQTKDEGYFLTGNFEYLDTGSSASFCHTGGWAAKLERVVSRSGEVVTWKAVAGVVLESVFDLKSEWKANQNEILSIGAANAIALVSAGQQRYYRLRGTGTNDPPSLSFGALLNWPVAANQILEFSSTKTGSWNAFSGDQGSIGATHYAIIPQNLKQHYFRTRIVD